MTIGSQLKAALAGNSGITNLVSTRIYPVQLPQTPTYEAITYLRVSNSGQNGTSTRRESRWQIDCWAQTYAEAHVLAGAVKTALEEYHDVSGIEYARVVNELDDYDPDVDAYRTIVDVILTTTGD